MEKTPENFDSDPNEDDDLNRRIKEGKKELEEIKIHDWEQSELYDQMGIEKEAVDKALEEAGALKEDIESTLNKKDISSEDIARVREKTNRLSALVDYINERLKIFDAANNEASDKQLMRDSQSQ